MKIHSVKYNSIMNIILKSSSLIFSLITTPYILRVLGVVNSGKVAFATSVISAFTMIASLGIPIYGIKICAQNREDREALGRTVYELLLLSLISTTIVYGLFIIMLFIYPPFAEMRELLVISSGTMVLTGLGIEWFYQAVEQYDYITIRNIAVKAISLVLIINCIHEPEDYGRYAIILVIASAGSNIFNLINVRKYIDIKPIKSYNILQHIRPVFILFLLTAGAAVYTNLDTIMLGIMVDDEAVGLYNAAVKIKVVLAGIVTAIGAVILPRASYYVKNGKKTELNKLIQTSEEIIVFISIPVILFFIIKAKDVISLFGGTEYIAGTAAMQIIMPTVLLIGLSDLIGMQIMIPFNMEKQTALSTFAGAGADFIFNVLLIPEYGVMGAAAATMIAEFVAFFIKARYIRNSFKLFIDKKNYGKIIISSGISALILIMVSPFFENIRILYRLILYVCVYGMAIFVTLILLKEKIMKILMHDIIKR